MNPYQPPHKPYGSTSPRVNLPEDMLEDHFFIEPIRANTQYYVCKHCGSMCTARSWELHVVACPALAANLHHMNLVYDRQTLIDKLEREYRNARRLEREMMDAQAEIDQRTRSLTDFPSPQFREMHRARTAPQDKKK